MKKNRNEWHGHLKEIASRCGCSTSAVSRILNGRSDEVTKNINLIEAVKRTASELIQKDIENLQTQITEKSNIAQQLVAA